MRINTWQRAKPVGTALEQPCRMLDGVSGTLGELGTERALPEQAARAAIAIKASARTKGLFMNCPPPLVLHARGSAPNATRSRDVKSQPNIIAVRAGEKVSSHCG